MRGGFLFRPYLLALNTSTGSVVVGDVVTFSVRRSCALRLTRASSSSLGTRRVPALSARGGTLPAGPAGRERRRKVWKRPWGKGVHVSSGRDAFGRRRCGHIRRRCAWNSRRCTMLRRGLAEVNWGIPARPASRRSECLLYPGNPPCEHEHREESYLPHIPKEGYPQMPGRYQHGEGRDTP